MTTTETHSSPKPFTPSDVDNYGICPRSFWLRRNQERVHLGIKAAIESNPKRVHDQASVRDRFDEKIRAQVEPSAKIVFTPHRGDHNICPAEPQELVINYGPLQIHPQGRKHADGSWDLLHVRASSANAETLDKKVGDGSLFSMALQAWALEKSGKTINRATLSLLNKDFRPGAGVDRADLFIDADVLADLKSHYAGFNETLDEHLKAMETLETEQALPRAAMGPHCTKGHGCPFQDFCGSQIPEDDSSPVELLPGPSGKSIAKKLRKAGITSLLDATDQNLEANKASDTELFRRIRDAHTKGTAVLTEAAKPILEGLAYPRYYFDFEGIDLATPRWDGIAPYTQIPFQWSCHAEVSPGEFRHAEFLDLSGKDPSQACAESMFASMPTSELGPIFVFHKQYEEGRITELATRHPELASELEKYLPRLVDLLPLVKSCYYHPHMRGSFSIKTLLPCIAPAVTYGALEVVQNGIEAQVAYLRAIEPNTHSGDIDSIARQLFAYCRQDTWAMVLVAFFLARRDAPAGDSAPSMRWLHTKNDSLLGAAIP